jgi:hypothetical protein
MKVDLPNERLTTTTETGKRIYVYPQLVHGFWQRRRAIVYSLLVFFFLAIPWIRLNDSSKIQYLWLSVLGD